MAAEISKWNAPNILSGYRLLSAPVMLAAIIAGYEKTFVTLFIIAQITDILDGYLARRLHLESDFGTRLDSYADIGSYVCGFVGILQFHRELFRDYSWWVAAFGALYILDMLMARLRFGTVAPGLHLYSSKIAGYLQGGFLVMLFAYRLLSPFFFVMMIWSYLSMLEGIIINSFSARPVLNAKGIFWVLKEDRWR